MKLLHDLMLSCVAGVFDLDSIDPITKGLHSEAMRAYMKGSRACEQKCGV